MPMTTQHTMIGHLPIWTVTVETEDQQRRITQTQDYIDVCQTIGMAVVDAAKHITVLKQVTVLDGNEPFLDVTLDIKDVAEQAHGS